VQDGTLEVEKANPFPFQISPARAQPLAEAVEKR
jgi:hypothetical protein